ncbi:MAG TPA: hypothetical protein VF784_15275 [Anaerolineales bacterium]
MRIVVNDMATPLDMVDGSMNPSRAANFPTGITSPSISGIIVNGLKPAPINVLTPTLPFYTRLRYSVLMAWLPQHIGDLCIALLGG